MATGSKQFKLRWPQFLNAQPNWFNRVLEGFQPDQNELVQDASIDKLFQQYPQFDWCWDSDKGLIYFRQEFVEKYVNYISQTTLPCHDFIACLFEQDRTDFINAIYQSLENEQAENKICARLYDREKHHCRRVQYKIYYPVDKCQRKVLGTMQMLDSAINTETNPDQASITDFTLALTQELVVSDVEDTGKILQQSIQRFAKMIDSQYLTFYSYQKIEDEITGVREYCANQERRFDVILQKYPDHSLRLEFIRSYDYMLLPNSILDKERQTAMLKYLSCDSLLVLPVHNQDNFSGVFLLGVDHTKNISDEFISSLKSLSNIYYMALNRYNSHVELQNRDNSLNDQQRIAKMGSWKKDTRTGKLTCSPEARTIFEIDSENEFSDFNYFMSIIHPDDLAYVSTVVSNAIKKNLAYDLTYRIITNKGNVKYINGRADVLRDDNHQVYQRIGTVADVTYIKRAETALQKSESRMRNLLNSTAEGLFGVNSLGECTFINKSALDILGCLHQSEVVGKKVCDFIGAKKSNLCDFSQAFIKGQEIHQDLNIINKQGENIRLELWAHPLKENEAIDGCVIAFFDVTEKRLAEEQLKQSSVFFECTREGVVITNQEKKIITVNQAFTDITGFDKEEVEGKSPLDLIAACNDEAIYLAMLEKIKNGGFWQGELVGVRKNGEVFPEWVTINAVLDDDGSLLNYVVVFNDISPIKNNEEKIENISNYDLLTHLPNRTLLTSKLTELVARADVVEKEFSVLLIDIDNFKNINDSLGHNIGDELLVAISQRLSDKIRTEDILSRVGGDEFVIVADNMSSEEQVEPYAQRILEALSTPFNINGHDLFVAASIGISRFPDDASDATQFLSSAESAMYLAKDSGRNCFRFYNASLLSDAHDRLHTESELRKALMEEDELRLYYQPQVCMTSGAVIGAEALVRWIHPENGLMPPGLFLPAAEKAGLMATLDYWVIRKACKQLVTWHEQGVPKFKLAVNVTKHSFMDKQFIYNISSILESTGADPKFIELEITEGALIEPSESVMSTITSLKSMGFSLAVDDFGTGYSSLAYLQKFNVDKLKIDRSFVIDMLKDPQSEVITSTIISMAKSLHLDVLAEGVETEEQLELLKSKGCETYQGFFFSKPIDSDAFQTLISNH